MCHTLTVQSTQLAAKCSSTSKTIKPVCLDAIRQACEVKMIRNENKALFATLPPHDCLHLPKIYICEKSTAAQYMENVLPSQY